MADTTEQALQAIVAALDAGPPATTRPPDPDAGRELLLQEIEYLEWSIDLQWQAVPLLQAQLQDAIAALGDEGEELRVKRLIFQHYTPPTPPLTFEPPVEQVP